MPILVRVPARPSAAARPPTEFVARTPSTPSCGDGRPRSGSACAGRRRRSAASRARPPTSRIAWASPSQRASMPTLSVSWLRQSALRTPASASRRPASRPARLLDLPDVGEHAEPRKTSLPELIETTGMPAATARRIAGASPSDGIETTRPSGLVATAWSISSLIRSHAEDVGRPVVDEHVEAARGGVDAVADDRPELARRRAVGDDRDPHRAVGHRRARHRRGRRRAGDLDAVLAHDLRCSPQPASRSDAAGGQGASSGHREARAQTRAVSNRAVDLERAADRRDAVVEAADAAARGRVDAADAVVGRPPRSAPRRTRRTSTRALVASA